MKKFITTFLLLAWFFGFRMETGEPGVFATLITGPYRSRAACEKSYQASLASMQALFGDEFEAQPCRESI